MSSPEVVEDVGDRAAVVGAVWTDCGGSFVGIDITFPDLAEGPFKGRIDTFYLIGHSDSMRQ